MSWGGRAAPAVLGAALALGSGAARAQQNGPAEDTLTLARAIQVTLAEQPSISRARAAEAAATADRLAAFGSFLPTVEANASLSRSAFTSATYVSPQGLSQLSDPPTVGVLQSTMQSLYLQWDLLRGGQRFVDLGATAAADRAAGLRVTDAERQAVLAVKQDYLDAYLQQRFVEMDSAELEARQRDLEIARRRYEIAAIDRGDLLGAQIQVRRAELKLADARDRAREVIRKLQVDMGRPGDVGGREVLRDVGALPDADSLDSEALVREALGTNPGLSALEADAAAAGSRLWSARSAYLPTLSIGLNLNRSENLGPNDHFFTLDPRDHGHALSVTASWRLLDGFARHKDAAQAAMARDQAAADHAQESHEIERDVRNLVAEVQRRQERLRLEREVADLSSQRVGMAREQFRRGTLSYIDLQQLIDQSTNAEEDVAQELHDARVAWAKLDALVGGGS